MAVLIELELLMLALEQGVSEEAFQRLDATAQRRCGKCQLLRRGFDGPSTGDLNERFQGGKGWQATHERFNAPCLYVALHKHAATASKTPAPFLSGSEHFRLDRRPIGESAKGGSVARAQLLVSRIRPPPGGISRFEGLHPCVAFLSRLP